MFVKVSGFGQASGITLPLHVRNSEEDTSLLLNSEEDTSSVVFAVVRWLSAHPSATLRDSKGRPVCPPPLDTNHALWTYSKLSRRRAIFYTRAPYFRSQLSAFAGSDDIQRIRNSNTEAFAYYGMVPRDFCFVYELHICQYESK